MQKEELLKKWNCNGKSKISLHIWMFAFIFMSATRKGFSCLEFQRQVSLSRYDTAFRLMHKIRAMMGKSDSLYILNDMIEFDECFVEVATKKQVKQNLKRGKGSQRQAKVAVAAESTPLEDPRTGKKDRACGCYKMGVLGKVDLDHVNKFIKKNAAGVLYCLPTKTQPMLILQIILTHITWLFQIK